MPSEFQGQQVQDEKRDYDQVKSGISRGFTFGEKLVGLTFNPSNDEKVQKAKELCAALADLLHDTVSNSESSEHSNILINHTYGEILNAQMNVVKVLTLKY